MGASVTTAAFLTAVIKMNMVKRKINGNKSNYGKHDTIGTKRIHVRTFLKSKFKKHVFLTNVIMSDFYVIYSATKIGQFIS
jgi:hypothetical protein